MAFDDQPMRPPRPIRPVRVPRRRNRWAPVLISMLVALVLLIVVANVWTEIAWYRQVGFEQVWRTQWVTRLTLFFVFGLIAAAAVVLTLWLAKRFRPKVSTTRDRSLMDAYREQFEPIERAAMIGLPIVVGIIAGSSISVQWMKVLGWWNAVPFGVTDPQFGLDASFYVFTLPAYKAFLTYFTVIVVICAILSAFVHLLYGGIGGGGRKLLSSKAARIQLGVLGALAMIGFALSYWLDRYLLITKAGDLFDGAAYTDVNAVIPGRAILAGIALVVALMFVGVIFRPDWRIPAVGVGLMVLSALVVGGIYPAIVSRFKVQPNQQELEALYIQRNIDATLYAYGLDDVEVTPYNARTEALPGALRADAETTAQIRLLDPNIVTPAFQQLQQNKQYYNFGDQLTVDRYLINGELRDTVIAVRELNLGGISDENRSWVNDHTVFTHGFGVVAAYGNRVNQDGQPAFFEGGIPSTGELGDYEPRIYFGTTSPDYSIVGAPAGSVPWELDYPDDAAGGQVNTTYTGDGGPRIGGFLEKLFFSIRFGEEQIFFSERVTDESQILYYRDPIERVARVAPYLELDATTYPAVVDGRVVWIVDGYTTTDQFPYADALKVFVFEGADVSGESNSGDSIINYVRNSVKATVDAYDGSVTLYAWDPEDPVLQTWAAAFPDSLTEIKSISADLMGHLRYPEALFQIQRYQLQSYHVADAAEFYSAQDFWRNPADPNGNANELQPPYYLTLQMPGQEAPTFSLTTSFIPGGNSDRNVLTAFLAADSETGNQAGVVAEGYGKLRLIELPRDSTVPGPGQVQNQFNSNPEAQNVLNLLRQGETDVLNGNLLTLPVGGGLLYVQPVYVQSSQGTQFPLLRKVFVAFGDDVGFADTLAEALDQVFGSSTPVVEPEPTDPDPVIDPEAPAVSEARAALKAALAAAQQAIADGQVALADGDFAAYGAAQDRLAAALADAIAAELLIDEAIASTAATPAAQGESAAATP